MPGGGWNVNPPGTNSGAETLSGLPRDGTRICAAAAVAGVMVGAETDAGARLPNTNGLARGFSDSARGILGARVAE